MNYIIGPSHIHSNFTYQINDKLINKTLFNNCILDGYLGIPVWSKHIYNCINDNYNKNNVIWIISDYKLNNFNYPLIVNNQDELFHDEMGYNGNVSMDFLCDYHIETLGNHSLKVIDFIINKFPNIKLIFWCLYKRTKANKNSSYPKYLWYDTIKEKYKNNIIDIDSFINPEDFNDLLVLRDELPDEGGHPNKKGYILLDKMIKSIDLNL